jgi:TPR repeat protein
MKPVFLLLLVALSMLPFGVFAQTADQLRMKALSEASAAAARDDYAGAASLLELYAESGDAVAQNQLGKLYLSGGKGLPQDLAMAISLFSKAAAQGNGSSQRHLAIAYERGQGVAADPAMALKWYLKSANRGDSLAQLAVGKMYASGKGLPQDYVQAYKWLTLASSGSFTDSEKGMQEEALTNRTAIASKMGSSQISSAQKLIREWTPQ